MTARKKFETLDLLRALASVIVVLVHIQPFHKPLIPYGGLSVDLFFAISGFVIANAYETKLASGLGFGPFVKIRLVRLYPMYAFGTAIGVFALLLAVWLSGFALWKLKDSVLPALLAVFLLPRPAGSLIASYRFNPPAWSLFFELIANLLHATLLPCLSATGIKVGLLVSGVATILIQVISHRAGFGDTGWSMFFAVPRVAFPYLTGILVFRSWQKERLPKISAPAIGLAIMLLVVALVPPALAPAAVTTDAAVFLIFPFMLVAAVQNEPPQWLLPFARTGERLSYPLYMIHVPLIMIAEAGIHQGLWSAPLGYVAAVVIALAVAFLAERFFDRPVRRWLNAILRQRWSPQSEDSVGPA